MKRNASNICPDCDAGDPTSVITECDCASTPARRFGFRYAIELTDHHPTLGGKRQVQGWNTRKEATWYGDREVEAARELGIADVTYRVIRLA